MDKGTIARTFTIAELQGVKPSFFSQYTHIIQLKDGYHRIKSIEQITGDRDMYIVNFTENFSSFLDSFTEVYWSL